ncbi:uncharacterized protein LOC127245198 isoform X1 [Andrographis paniculata]|uniref:uncharacterized protein LOC127245198 isoform X1 n=1 Tax=Andrographis paniculata TaxID=175694 RepID=UPI0021E9855F|nr:uncharacterized protein LOC127245198 isoform X1 [Andrographis paniculata]
MATKPLPIILITIAISVTIIDAQSPVGIVHVNSTLYCTATGSSGSSATPVFPKLENPVFEVPLSLFVVVYVQDSYMDSYKVKLLDATLEVACSGDDVANNPSTDTSNAAGMFRVVLIPRPNATVDSIVSNCRIFVLTPLSTCNPALPPTGLRSNLKFVRTVFSFLRLTYMVPAGFTSQD